MENDKYLDEEFRQCVSNMKPHTKSLPYKSEERHRVTLWIKKLLALRTNKEGRNACARQLLQMLKSGKLSEPFTTLPPLTGLPSPSPPKKDLERGGETSPLGSRGGGGPLAEVVGGSSSPFLLSSDFHPPLTSSVMSATSSVGVSRDQGGDSVDFRPLSVYSSIESLCDQSEMVTLQATPTPRPLSQPPHSSTGGKLTSEILHQREMELLLRSTETCHQEEKLRLQREHEDAIQQLLRKRTKELEEVREECKGQMEQLKTRNTHLEKRVADLQRELSNERRDGGAGGRGNPLLSDHRNQLQAEFDQKLYRTITDFERQKLELERRHAKHVQQVVTDCGRRIDQMERDCATQISTSSAVVAEMEGRVQELTQQNSSIATEKESLKAKIQSLEQKLQEAHKSGSEWRERVSVMERERMEEKRSAEVRMESRLREKETEHSLEETRFLEKVCKLEQQLQQWQETHREMTESHHREMAEARRSMEEMRSSVSISEGRLGRMRMAQERQSQQAEVAIEEFKTQVEEQSSKVFSSLHGELERLAAELAECRLERNRSAEEWAMERREERQRISTQLQAMEACHKHEKEELISQHSTQLDSQHKKLERAKEHEVSRLQQRITELQTQTKATASRTARSVFSLEDKLQQLQQDMKSQKSLHSRDTARLRRRLEEERQSANKMKESAVSDVRGEWQEERKRTKMKHQREINTLKDKHSQIVQQLNHFTAQEAAKTAETISSLQAQVQSLTADISRQGSSFKEQLDEVERAREQERASLRHHHDLIMQSVREEADASQQIVSQLQERLTKLQQEHMVKVSTMRLQFQTSLSGMMPMAVKKEYDETVKALRSQLGSLEQRRALLQNELEQLRPVVPSYHHRNSVTHTQTQPQFLRNSPMYSA